MFASRLFILGLPLLLASLITASPSVAQPSGFSIQRVLWPIAFATTLRFTPEGRLFVTELYGRVVFYSPPLVPTPNTWAQLVPGSAGEDGVHGLSIHPDFPDSPYVYIAYTNADPHVDRLVRYRDHLGQGIEPTVLMEWPTSANSHHGGRIAFGPDGMIYLTNGDQDDRAAAQVTTTTHGKIFRIGRGGEPAPGNPWGPLNPAGLMGVRNVFGLCFDPLTGTGYFTENGPECDDELNILSIGSNYGWGPTDVCGSQSPGTTLPLVSFTPTIAPTGCCIYRGGVYPSRFEGSLFFGAYNDRRVYRADFHPGMPNVVDSVVVFAEFSEQVLDVTVGPDGLLWVATTGSVWRVDYDPVTGVDPPAVPHASLRVGPNPSWGRVFIETPQELADGSLDVFDLGGRRVRHWESRLQPVTIWDGRTEEGTLAPPGVYLVRLSARGFQSSRRVVRLGS